MTKVLTLSFRRGRLPHWLVADHSYFVTLCRKGCLPAHVIAELRAERLELARITASNRSASGTSARPPDPHANPLAAPVGRDVPDRPASARRAPPVPTAARLLAARQRFTRIDSYLDAAHRSERDLCVPSNAAIILESVDWLRTNGWRIWAATLMPSHIHMVMRNMAGRNDELRQMLSRFMAYTARIINAKDAAKGRTVWQREGFDHWCRDNDSWRRSVCYTVNNPVHAGLAATWSDWPFTIIDPDVAPMLS